MNCPKNYRTIVYLEDGNYWFTNDDSVNIDPSVFRYGHTENFDYGFFTFENFSYEFIGKPSIGADLGFEYEWRPNRKDHEIKLPDGRSIERNEKNKYKLKIGFSVNDIGRIRFDKDPDSYDFEGSIYNWDLTNIKLKDVQSFDDTLNNRFPNALADNELDYKMNLPLALSLQVDYKITKNLYVNLLGYLSPKMSNNINKVHGINTLGASLRYENLWFGAALPVSYNSLRDFNVGLSLRAGPLFIGAGDIGMFLWKKNIESINIFAGLKVSFHGIG